MGALETNYIVVIDTHYTEFTRKVSEWRRKQWTCVGGVCVTGDSYLNCAYHQAMERIVATSERIES